MGNVTRVARGGIGLAGTMAMALAVAFAVVSAALPTALIVSVTPPMDGGRGNNVLNTWRL